jgi:hypothetical protein
MGRRRWLRVKQLNTGRVRDILPEPRDGIGSKVRRSGKVAEKG